MQRCKARSSQNDGRMRREHEQSDGLVLLTKCVILKLYLVNKCIHTSDVDLSVFYNVLYVLWSQMFGDPCYTRCFVMLLMKPGELCGKQVLKVRQQLFVWSGFHHTFQRQLPELHIKTFIDFTGTVHNSEICWRLSWRPEESSHSRYGSKKDVTPELLGNWKNCGWL